MMTSATSKAAVTRTAFEISHNDDFDAIYEKRFRKYLLLLAKEKELLKRMGGRSRRHRSSTIGNGLDTSEIDLAIAESELKGNVDSCFYKPPRSTHSNQRPLLGRKASSVKDLRKLSHHRRAVFFENDFDIKRLSIKMEESEADHEVDSDSNDSSCSSFSSLSASQKMSSSLTNQHLLPAYPQLTNAKSMDDLLSSSNFYRLVDQTSLNKSRSVDMVNDDINEEQPDHHSSVLPHQSSDPIPIRVTPCSPVKSPSSVHLPISMAKSFENLFSHDRESLRSSITRTSHVSQRLPISSIRRETSLLKAKSCETLLTGRYDEQVSGSLHVTQPAFSMITALRRSTFKKVRSFESLLGDEEGTCTLSREITQHALPLSDRNAMMTSSVRNLTDRNVRENIPPKTLRSDSPYLQRLRNAAKERQSKRTEVLKKLDTDFTKAKEIIKRYKSNEHLSPRNEDVLITENQNDISKRQENNDIVNVDTGDNNNNRIPDVDNKIPHVDNKISDVDKKTDVAKKIPEVDKKISDVDNNDYSHYTIV